MHATILKKRGHYSSNLFTNCDITHTHHLQNVRKQFLYIKCFPKKFSLIWVKGNMSVLHLLLS